MKNPVAVYLAAILSTLAEVEGGSPESTLYLAIGGDINLWQTLKTYMLDSGLIEVKGHYVTLTAKGRPIAEECNELFLKQKQQTPAVKAC